jgi:hypothetical protein
MSNSLVGFIMGEDDIFDDFELTKEEKEKLSKEQEKTNKEVVELNKEIEKEKETTFVDKEKHPKEEYIKPKGSSRKVQAVIGLGLFVGVGVLIYLALTGMIDVTDNEPFDASQCEYGTMSGFFEKRCMTEEEFLQAEEGESTT